METETINIKRMLYQLYFKNSPIQNYDQAHFQLVKKERRFLKFLPVPDRWKNVYMIVIRVGQDMHRKPIDYSDKEAIKYFIKLMNKQKK